MGRNSLSYSSFAFSIKILTERGTSLFVNQFKDLERKKTMCQPLQSYRELEVGNQRNWFPWGRITLESQPLYVTCTTCTSSSFFIGIDRMLLHWWRQQIEGASDRREGASICQINLLLWPNARTLSRMVASRVLCSESPFLIVENAYFSRNLNL